MPIYVHAASPQPANQRLAVQPPREAARCPPCSLHSAHTPCRCQRQSGEMLPPSFRNVQARSLFRIFAASSASSPFTQSRRLKYARIAGRVLISSNSPSPPSRPRAAASWTWGTFPPFQRHARRFPPRSAFPRGCSARRLQNAVQPGQFAPDRRKIDVHARLHQTG